MRNLKTIFFLLACLLVFVGLLGEVITIYLWLNQSLKFTIYLALQIYGIVLILGIGGVVIGLRVME